MHTLCDRFGRRIGYLRIAITDRCNLRCLYCMPEQYHAFAPADTLLRFDELLAVVEAGIVCGIRTVRITGGEPLTRPGLVEWIGALSRLGLDDLALTTNGMLLERYAEPLARSGLKRVNISLDSLEPERFTTITRMGRIEAVLAGIARALAAGLSPVKVNVVVMRGVNDDEVERLARLTFEWSIAVRFIELMPIGETGWFRRDRIVTAEEVRRRLEQVAPLVQADDMKGPGPARYWRWPGAAGTIGCISAVSEPFCASCNRLRLTATGRLRPCLDDEQSIDLVSCLRPTVDHDGLISAFHEAVGRKPECHTMQERETSLRTCMVGIGG